MKTSPPRFTIFCHRHPVHAAVRAPRLRATRARRHPQVARVRHQTPELAEDVVDLFLTSRVQLALLAPEPVQIGPRRHIRGFLRRLRGHTTHCPPSPCARLSRAPTTTRTPPPSPGRRWAWQLAGLRVPGARVEVLVFRRGNPWCGRWTTVPLATRTARRIGTRRRRAHSGRTQSAVVTNQALAACSPTRASLGSIQRVQSSSSAARALARALFHRGTCGNPPQEQLRLCGQFGSLGCCRPPFQPRRRSRSPSAPGPTRARMTSFFLGHRSSSSAFTTHSTVHHSPHDDEFHDFEESEKVAAHGSDLAPDRCPPGAQLTMAPRDFALRPVTTDSQNQPFSCGSRVKRRH